MQVTTFYAIPNPSKLIITIVMNSTEVRNPRRKLDDKLPYVFSSVLACAKSAHMFQKLSYLLCRLLSLSFLTNYSSSDSNERH